MVGSGAKYRTGTGGLVLLVWGGGSSHTHTTYFGESYFRRARVDPSRLVGDAPFPLRMGDVDALLRQFPELKSNLSAAERAAMVSNDTYWRNLCPKLHVASPSMMRRLAEAIIEPEADLVDELRDRMCEDGYWEVFSDGTREDNGQVHLKWAVSVADMAEAMTTLTQAGWPPSFLLMYDEPWLIAHQLKNVIRMTSGNRLLFDFAFFNVGSNLTPTGEVDVDGGASSRGWAPHRDRGQDETTSAFRNDGSPQYCTTWVALTEATTYSSCLVCVPKRHDPGYSGGDAERDPMGAIIKASGSSALQYIRALPVSAGSVVHFSHRLLHWGSAAAGSTAWKQQAPRIAMSFASADSQFEQPFLTDDASRCPLPAISTRAGLIAGLAIFYIANEDPGEWRTRLYWDCFRASQCEGCFSERFARIVAENFYASEAAWDLLARGGKLSS